MSAHGRNYHRQLAIARRRAQEQDAVNAAASEAMRARVEAELARMPLIRALQQNADMHQVPRAGGSPAVPLAGV